MEENGKNILKNILSDFVNSNITTDIKECYFNDVYKLANINNLTGILYYQVKDTNINKVYLKELENNFLITCSLALKKEVALIEIDRLLDDNEIKHIFFKGAVIKDIYPVPELRTMGDIDILVEEENVERIKEILINNGYDFDNIFSYTGVMDFKKSNILFEVHTSLVYEEFKQGMGLVKYFKDYFKKAFKIKNYQYGLNVNDHFIYLVAHLSKHYYTGGSGIRMFLDIAIYMNYYKDMFDKEYIETEAKKIGLYKFLCLTNEVCSLWFGSAKIFDDFFISDELLEQIEDYVFNGGIFGMYNDDNYSHKMMSLYTGKEDKISRLKIIFCYLFPSDEHMRSWCSWYSKVPKVLLPISWIYRIIYVIFMRKENALTHAKKVMSDSKELDVKYLFLKKSGL